MYKNKHFLSSLKNAFNGMKLIFITEKNARIHLLATILVILIASLLHLSSISWILLLLAISLVWICELINTSIENLFDVSQPEIDSRVRTGKDLSAAAVLISSLISIIVGILILGPPIYRFISSFFYRN